MHQEVITQIEAAWENRELLKDKNTQESIRKVIEWLDKGEVRVSESLADGKWKLNEWINLIIDTNRRRNYHRNTVISIKVSGKFTVAMAIRIACWIGKIWAPL